MKYLVVLYDGMADYPVPALDGKTPMELAKKPLLDKLARFGKVGTVKTVADGLMPVSGKVIEVNAELEGAPESVNSDPYGAGWMIKVEMSNPAEVEDLLDADAYDAICK